MTQETYRYQLSKNDLDIIKYYNSEKGVEKPLSDNAKKTLTILAEVFQGLHHLEPSILKKFDYQEERYSVVKLKATLSTFDPQNLTLLVICCADMAVRLSIRASMNYLELQFNAREREGDFSRRHDSIEDTIKGFRANNRTYV